MGGSQIALRLANPCHFDRIWDTRKLNALSLDLSDPAPLSPPPSSPEPSDDSQHPAPVSFGSDVINEFIATPKGKGCLRGEWRHDKSVSSAYWDPRGRGIVSTSYDDTLRREFTYFSSYRLHSMKSCSLGYRCCKVH